MTPRPQKKMNCILGVDFDNTLVDYDAVFLKTAKARGLIRNDVGMDKKNIRDVIRQLPDGEKKWQELQARVYGQDMNEAVLIDGVEDFFQICGALGIEAYIISHKTQFAAQDIDNIDLRQVALGWMKQNNFFDPKGIGLSPDRVFFESTRQDKIRRIKELGCTCFIDDLQEIFLEESFPRGVQQILYDPHGRNSRLTHLKIFQTWKEIKEYFYENSELLSH